MRKVQLGEIELRVGLSVCIDGRWPFEMQMFLVQLVQGLVRYLLTQEAHVRGGSASTARAEEVVNYRVIAFIDCTTHSTALTTILFLLVNVGLRWCKFP